MTTDPTPQTLTMNTNKHPITFAFITIRAAHGRITERMPAPVRWKAEIVTRGNGTVLYTSPAKDSGDAAREMAFRYVESARGNHIALTTPLRAPRSES